MPRPLLVVVSGPPGAGKTTLGKRLAGCLGLPFLNKDGFKETLFDSLGWSDLEWSHRLGAASIALLFHTAERLLAAHQSLVMEANFSADLSCKQFQDLQRTYDVVACQVQCVADGEVLVRRFHERNTRGERHPGHVDHLPQAHTDAVLRRGRGEQLCLDGPSLEVDTTDFARVDVDALCRCIASLRTVPSSTAATP